LADSSAALRAARPNSLHVLGQVIWPSYSSVPSQHTGSQIPSFTCDDGIYEGLCPAFVQWNRPFRQAGVPNSLIGHRWEVIPGSSEPSRQSQ
jgi:hypothetical protein